MSPLESSITKSILKRLRSRGVRVKVIKLHISPFMPAGEPDIVGCYVIEGAAHGVPFVLEVKQPGEKPTKIQLVRLEEWRKAGAKAAVVCSADEAETFLFGAT